MNCNSCNGCDIEVFGLSYSSLYDAERFGVLNIGTPSKPTGDGGYGSHKLQKCECAKNIYNQIPDPKLF